MKLVRHLLPTLPVVKGHEHEFRPVADEAEHWELLRQKPEEETKEWWDSVTAGWPDPEEIADVLAAWRDIAAKHGYSWNYVLELEAAKRSRRGGFEIGMVWTGEHRWDQDTGERLPARGYP